MSRPEIPAGFFVGLRARDVVGDHVKIEAAYAELTAAQAEVDTLYARWAELEVQIE